MRNSINKRIKEIRIKSNIAPGKIAEKLNITTKEYLRLEESQDISCENLKKITEILNVNILKILYDTFEYNKLQEKEWFISMINEYTAPYFIIREENEFAKNYYDSLKNFGK